jgi:hypothetical protein
VRFCKYRILRGLTRYSIVKERTLAMLKSPVQAGPGMQTPNGGERTGQPLLDSQKIKKYYNAKLEYCQEK